MEPFVGRWEDQRETPEQREQRRAADAVLWEIEAEKCRSLAAAHQDAAEAYALAGRPARAALEQDLARILTRAAETADREVSGG